MNHDFFDACAAALTAGLNGTLQGLLIALLVGVALRFLPQTNAATRHAVWWITFLLIAAMIPAQWLYTVGASSAKAFEHEAGMGEANDLVLLAETEPAASPPAEAPALVCIGPGTDSDTQAFLISRESQPESVPGVRRSAPESTTVSGTTKGASFGDWISSLLPFPLKRIAGPKLSNSMAAGLFLLWLSLAGARLVRLAWHLHWIRRLKAGARLPGEELAQRFAELSGHARVARSVLLRISSCQNSPVLLGFFHPMILLPERFACAGWDEMEPVLRHELAHVQRRDDWVNLVQHLVQACFFFHPALWWISNRLNFEREIACDDCVLQQGASHRTYALLLANLASDWQRPLALAPGVSNRKSQLQQRIHMILNTRRNTSARLARTRLGLLAATAGVLAVAGIYFAPRVILAQDHATPTPPTASAVTFTPALPEGLPPAHVASALTVFAQASTPAPGARTSAARFKPDDLPTPAPGAVTVVAGTPSPPEASDPSLPEPALAPEPPGAPPGHPRLPRAAMAPRPPRAPNLPDGASIEERLARLEELVHTMMAQQHLNQKQHRDEAVARMKMEADHDALRATEDAWRLSKQRDDLFRGDAEKSFEKQQENLGHQLDMMRRQRDTLQREMDKLQRQIERIERDHQLFEKQSQDEKQRGQPKAESK